jgi:hypothetical protein
VAIVRERCLPIAAGRRFPGIISAHRPSTRQPVPLLRTASLGLFPLLLPRQKPKMARSLQRMIEPRLGLLGQHSAASDMLERGKLVETFLPVEVHVIIQIPLSLRNQENRWAWHFEKDGFFSV